MPGDVERPRHEQADAGEPVYAGIQANFARAVAPLAEGELTLPAPFDLVTSWALARNSETGQAALELFARGVDGSDRRFQIRIHELPPDDDCGVAEREIVDCIVTGSRTAAHLLAGVADEIAEEHTE